MPSLPPPPPSSARRELFIPETQEIVRPHEQFMLFATQNPPGLYGGRKALSLAFRNRFLELHVDDIPGTLPVSVPMLLCKQCRYLRSTTLLPVGYERVTIYTCRCSYPTVNRAARPPDIHSLILREVCVFTRGQHTLAHAVDMPVCV